MQRINAALALICFATALIVHAASAGNMVFFSVMVDKTGIAFDGDGPLMISIIAMIIGFLCGWISHGPWAMGSGFIVKIIIIIMEPSVAICCSSHPLKLKLKLNASCWVQPHSAAEN